MPGPAFLTGETVDLHTVEEEDVDFLQRGVNDERVWRRIGRPDPVNALQEQEFVEEVVTSDDAVVLLVCADGEPVGTVGLHGVEDRLDAELGYWVHPDHHRNGYATAAARMMVGYALDQLGLHRVTARVFAFNDASRPVLESVGFTREGTRREAVFVDGAYHDVHYYGLLAEEW